MPPLLMASQTAEDDEEILIAWLTPLYPTKLERITDDPLPMILVNHVAGTENVDEGTAAPVCSVHTLVSKTPPPDAGVNGRVYARNAAKATHSRILRLAESCDAVQLTDGRWVGVDYVQVEESPLWVPYGDDLILRKVGRYELGLTYDPD